jgi:hypothetical protein
MTRRVIIVPETQGIREGGCRRHPPWLSPAREPRRSGALDYDHRPIERGSQLHPLFFRASARSLGSWTSSADFGPRARFEPG